MKERFNPKSIARTALAASLPLAAGLSACGDGAKQPENPSFLPPIAGPINPTPELERTTITLEANCPPTNLNTPDSYNKVISETVARHGGAVVVTVKGLTCEKDNAPYVPLTFMRTDIFFNPNAYDLVNINIFGYGDGSDAVAIFPATSCSGEYSLATRTNNPNILQSFLIPDEKTNELAPTFRLYEDCIKTIILEPDTPRDLN